MITNISISTNPHQTFIRLVYFVFIVETKLLAAISNGQIRECHDSKTFTWCTIIG